MLRALTVEEICKKLKPVMGKKIETIYLRYKLSDDKETKQEIEKALHAMFEQKLNTSLLDEKVLLLPPENLDGPYRLGTIKYAGKEFKAFCLREQDFIRHICISGMSGSGKTNLAFILLEDFIKKNKPVIIFDWKKSFRPLLNLDKNMQCFTIGNAKVSNLFKININEPPEGVDPKEWVGLLCDLITESFFASYGVHKILSETVDKAFRDFGVYNGSKNYPTWHQIKDRLEEQESDMKGKKGRDSEWLTSALRIAHALTFGHFGEAINSKNRHSLKVEDLLNKKVIFELNSLSTAEKKFFCEYIMTYIYKYKKASDEARTEEFKSAILVDEAHNIFLKDKTKFMKESVTEMIYREIREYGISLVCLDQHISKLSDVVAGNSACNIAFQQMLPQDVECVSGLMQIRENKNYFTMLPVGAAIVKLAERHFAPFEVEVQLSEIKKQHVSDKEISEKMQKVIKETKSLHAFKERCDINNLKRQLSKVDTICRISGVKTTEDSSDPALQPISQSYNLAKNQHKFLKFVKTHSGMGVAKVYESLGLSARKGNELKQELESLGFVKVAEQKDQKGWKKTIHLTDLGEKAIKA